MHSLFPIRLMALVLMFAGTSLGTQVHAQTAAPQPSTAIEPTAKAKAGRAEPLITDEQARKAIHNLSRIVDIEAEKSSLPDNAWINRDKGDVDREITELLTELSQVLGSSGATGHWRGMQKRQKELAAKLVEIDRLTQEADLNPDKRKEVEQQIETARKRADDLKKRVNTAKQAANEALRRAGVDLNESQLDALASTVVGDDIIDLVTRVTNFAALLERMRDNIVQGAGSPEAQRRYYAAVVVVQKITLGVQKRYLAKVEDRYLPFVDQVIVNTARTSDETVRLRKTETNADRIRVLEANLKAQRLTTDTAHLYKQQLEAQRSYARNAINESERTLNVALNTRDTVAISLDLLASIDASQDLFRVVQSLRLPAIQPFDSTEVQRSFERLTAEMSAF